MQNIQNKKVTDTSLALTRLAISPLLDGLSQSGLTDEARLINAQLSDTNPHVVEFSKCQTDLREHSQALANLRNPGQILSFLKKDPIQDLDDTPLSEFFLTRSIEYVIKNIAAFRSPLTLTKEETTEILNHAVTSYTVLLNWFDRYCSLYAKSAVLQVNLTCSLIKSLIPDRIDLAKVIDEEVNEIDIFNPERIGVLNKNKLADPLATFEKYAKLWFYSIQSAILSIPIDIDSIPKMKHSNYTRIIQANLMHQMHAVQDMLLTLTAVDPESLSTTCPALRLLIRSIGYAILRSTKVDPQTLHTMITRRLEAIMTPYNEDDWMYLTKSTRDMYESYIPSKLTTHDLQFFLQDYYEKTGKFSCDDSYQLHMLSFPIAREVLQKNSIWAGEDYKSTADLFDDSSVESLDEEREYEKPRPVSP